MIKQGIVALFNASQDLYALIVGRLHPVELPAGTDLPALTYQVTSAPRADITLDRHRADRLVIEFNAFAGSYKDADAVLTVVRRLLNCAANLTLAGGARIIFSEKISEMDHFESESRVFRSSSEYQIQYSEPVTYNG